MFDQRPDFYNVDQSVRDILTWTDHRKKKIIYIKIFFRFCGSFLSHEYCFLERFHFLFLFSGQSHGRRSRTVRFRKTQ